MQNTYYHIIFGVVPCGPVVKSMTRDLAVSYSSLPESTVFNGIVLGQYSSDPLPITSETQHVHE